MTENSDIVMPLNATYSCHLLLKIVSSNAELMVWERRDFITLNQKMAAAASLYSFAEVTRKDIVPILCLKPSLVNASYKRRASDFIISFREFGFPSEGVVSDQQTIVSIPCVDLGSHLLRVLYDWMGVSNWLESYAALMLSIVYIEVCRRLGVTIVGAPVGEDFLIWPQTENPEELFKLSQGESWFARVNGSCVKHPQSKASDLNSRSLKTLELGSNRDIIGIALANLKRLYWKRASRAHPGLLLTSPLRPVQHTLEKTGKAANSSVLMLRPQELRLSTMASERLLILQPHNWALRRDHGMLLYHSRRYGEAVQELSICMAFAPVEEAEILEPFVEKLHLMRLESSWKSVKTSSTLTPRP